MKHNESLPPSSPSQRSPADVNLPPEQFVRLRDLLAHYSGVHLDTSRQRVLETGLARRLQITGIDLTAYERFIQSAAGHKELRQLAELVLNHETLFFRNGPHLRALQNVLLPELHRTKPIGAPIRIWSAGCSTGEEAYSLAIVAYEALGRPLNRQVDIWATDLSDAALQKARAGSYRGRSLNNLNPEQLRRYFQQRGDSYVVNDALRSLVRFDVQNLLEPFPEFVNNIDIIFCQNVTIYFQLDTCRKLIERFYTCLPPGGMLFLGFSETLWNVFDGFHSREVNGAYVYYKGRPISAPMTPAAFRQTQPPAPQVQPPQRPVPKPPLVVERSPKTRGDRPPNPDTGSQQHNRTKQTPTAAAQQQADEALLRQGRELLFLGQGTEALEVLRHISPQSDYASQALTVIARAHADRGDLDTAVAEVRRALEIDTLNEEAHLLLGVIYVRQGQWQLAVQQLERARYLNPSLALISFHLADAYRQLGKFTLAAREYRNTLRKLDGHPPDTIIDGVAVAWLRETCQRHLGYLPHTL